jgi:S-DNA-T family DNA segregation ATPase FtsK/SpoIIIE
MLLQMEMELRQAQARNLAEVILSIYAEYGVHFRIGDITLDECSFKFEVNLIPGSHNNFEDLKKHELHLQMHLKTPVVRVLQEKWNVCILVSTKAPDNRLLPILRHSSYLETTRNMITPCVVGVDYLAKPVIIDMSKLPNLVIGGASTSGKTMALICIIIGILSSRTPEQVRLLLIDCGAADLTIFNDFCVVVDDAEEGFNAILELKRILDERIALKRQNRDEFEKLPYYWVVIDESPTFISENNENAKLLASTLQTVLQKCRHARIGIILSAINPSRENLVIDLAPVAARICFRVAKTANSVTILNEGGAEDLMEQGDMLFLSPRHIGIQQLRGSFIPENEMTLILNELKAIHGSNKAFAIDEIDLDRCGFDTDSERFNIPVASAKASKSQADDKLFARIIIWTLAQEFISANSISKGFKIGWDRGNAFLDRLHQLGIVGDVDGKYRPVLPANIADLTDDVIEFLKRYGYSEDDLINAFDERN